jgi:uncharacterized protein
MAFNDTVLLPVTVVLMLFALVLAFVPVVPATAVQWAIGMLFAGATGFQRVTPLAAVVMTGIMLAGVTSSLWLPYFGMRGKGLSCLGMIAFLIGGVVGTAIPIPIVGSIIGGVAAVMVVEYARVREIRAAMQSGRAALKTVLLGFVLEFIFSLTIFIIFLVSVVTTG